jgi:hypothetical protein
MKQWKNQETDPRRRNVSADQKTNPQS